MPKTFPDEQKAVIRELHTTGMSFVAIAAEMKKRFPSNWSSKNAYRSVPRILKLAEENVSPREKSLDEMTREERYNFIEVRLRGTPRFRLAFKNFPPDEKDVFVHEYLSVIKSTDTLTEVEEQAVFASILELVLAFQALNRKEKEENWRDLSLNGEIEETDPRFRRTVDDRYQKEYDQHMKLYQKGMEQLKMSRSQRLKEVRSQKQTLVDLAESLSHKTTQFEVAREIERLAKMKDDELKRLLDNQYLYGIFEEYA